MNKKTKLFSTEVKYISLDLDGTVTNSAYDKMLWNEEIPKLYSEAHKVTLEEAKITTYAAMYSALFIEKIGNFTDVVYWLKRHKLDSNDWEKLLKRMKKYFFVYPDALKFIKNNYKKYKLILLTSTERRMLDIKLSNDHIVKYFYEIFSTPSDFKISMKNRDSFTKMLRKLDATSDEIIHIGDDYHMDYLVPKSLGIKAYHIERLKRKNKYSIKSLSELSSIL